MDQRQQLLDKIYRAQGNNAQIVIDCLKSKDVEYLTVRDLRDIFLNVICWEKNDKFAQDLYKLKASEVFRHIILPLFEDVFKH